ncbi:hypothetical protein A6R68_17712, partial [Neotoma lepida]
FGLFTDHHLTTASLEFQKGEGPQQAEQSLCRELSQEEPTGSSTASTFQKLTPTFIRGSSMEDKRPNRENISGGLLDYMYRMLPAYLKISLQLGNTPPPVPLLRKGLRVSALGRTSSPKEISYVSSNGPATLGCSSKETSSIKVLKFTQALDQQTATQLLKLAHEYRPETKQEKQQRLLARAEKKAAGKGDVPTKRPPVLRAGVNTVTTLVENKKDPLVVIAHDVDPIELVVFLSALCRKM